MPDPLFADPRLAPLYDTFEGDRTDLAAVRDRLAPHGRFAFETRRPEARAWEGWAAPFEASWTLAGGGLVRQRRELLDVALPLVRFRWSYELPGGVRIDSDSTMRFRDDEENRHLLRQAGLSVVECRQAPDRPGQERVYLTRSADG